MRCERKKGDEGESKIWGLDNCKDVVTITWDGKGLGRSTFGKLKVSFGDIKFEMFSWHPNRDAEYTARYTSQQFLRKV